MSRIVFAGNNPFYKNLLSYARDRRRLKLVGAFCDTEQAPGLSRWLAESDVVARPLKTLGESDRAASLLGRLRPDYFINFNASIIFDAELLAVPSAGSLNMHPGLLPEYAGLHTHQWAIRNGESEFGSTLHFMEPKVDAGDIVLQERFELSGDETGLTLFLECLDTGRELVEEALDLIAAGEPLPREPQDLSRRTLYRDREARDGTVDWEFPAYRILRFFRAADYGSFDSPTYKPRAGYQDRTVLLSNAEPGASTEASPGEIVSIHSERVEVACGDGRTLIVQIEPPDEADLQPGDVFR